MRCHFGQLWYGEAIAASNVVDYAKFYSRSHDAVIRVYDEAGNVIQTRPAVSPGSMSDGKLLNPPAAH